MNPSIFAMKNKALLISSLFLCSPLHAGTYGPLTYGEDSTSITILECLFNTSGELAIPASINGKPVTTIKIGAFQGQALLTGVSIPDSVSSIEANAFKGCLLLSKVSLSENVTSIRYGTFDSCSSLTSISLPKNLTSIEPTAFYGSGLARIIIPSQVSYLGDNVFNTCGNLSAIYFQGNAPSTIGAYPFAQTPSTIYFYSGSSGFTTPTWQSRPSVSMGIKSETKDWLISNGLQYDTNMNTMILGSSRSLLYVYAFGLSLSSSESGIMQSFNTEGHLTIQYFSGRSDVTYTPQTCSNLIDWTPQGVNVSTPDSNAYVTASTPSAPSPRFLRVMISQ